MTFSQHVQEWYGISHKLILKMGDRASAQQLKWQADMQGHSIGYELWHVARWADHLQARLPGMTEALKEILPARDEIWKEEGLGKAWGIPEPEALGDAETGISMETEAIKALPIPEKAVLLDYVKRVFETMDTTIAQIPEDQYLGEMTGNPGMTVFQVLMSFLYHEGRHLGMMEALMGLQGEPGSATA